MPSTHHSITVRGVGLAGLSCEELLQCFTDKQRRRIYSKRVLGLDASGNPLSSLTGVGTFTQLLSLSLARCKLENIRDTVLPSSLRHLDVSGNALTELHGIGQLVCLTWLDASSNALQSAAQLTACSQLCVLSLAQNQLTSLNGLEGLVALQSLDIGANCIRHELDIRTLAALPALRHLAMAGNPVMADMDPREQRVFVMDLMPGLLTLDRQAVSSSVSAHLYQVRMTKLGHVVPHVFDEQLLFESSDAGALPVVRIKHAPEAALKLARQQQQQLSQQLMLQQQPHTQIPNQVQPQQQTLPQQLHQSPLQSQQQLLQQQMKLNRPASAPGKPQVAFGHKADWDFSTGSKQNEGQSMGKGNGKPVRLTGQALALLGNTDWGRLRTEVPVNRHVTLEHACQSAHHTLPSGSAPERQRSPLKCRQSPDIAVEKSQSPDIARLGSLVDQHPSSLQQQMQALGSAASSPRSLSPNSYLARSGKLNHKAAQLRSSPPLSRPGKVETLNGPSPVHCRTSSPPPRLAADRHVPAQSATCGRRAGSRGRPSLTWQAALEEVRKMDKAKPSFMQSLRTRSLSPQSQGAECKPQAVSQPVWQKYQRHATPDRVSARPDAVRRVVQGMSRTGPCSQPQLARAFCEEPAEAGPSGLDHVSNQAPLVMFKPAKKMVLHKAPANIVAGPVQALPGMPWSPAGKALAPRASQGTKPSQPVLRGPSAKSRSEALQEGASGMSAGATLSQPRPIRAGQQALVALLSKQAAWECTRSTSLPPVLSEITTILQCNPEPVHPPPARSAQELRSADPQLGQLMTQPTTAVGRSPSQWQGLQVRANAAVMASDAVAVAAQPHDPETVGPEAATAGNSNLSAAKIVLPALEPSSSSASCSLKPEYRVSFAEQVEAALESEAQHAKHGAAQSTRKYFQETARAAEAEASDNTLHTLEQAEAEEGARQGAEQAELLSETAEEGMSHSVGEQEVRETVEDEGCQDALETLCDAAETCELPSPWSPMSPATSDAQSHPSLTAGPEAEPASEREAASAVEPEADVSRLESFLHTVTAADEVLNDLLGELSGSSSSSSPAQLSRQSSSSALPSLAEEQSNDHHQHDVTSANFDAFTLASPADGALQSSSSAQQDAAGIHASSSSAALFSDALHSESSTDVVLDTLLEDLRSAELSRQSSSSVLLSRLTSLAEMRRRSASSSPVAGTSQADMLRQPSSCSEQPVVAVTCDSADTNAQSASSTSEEPTCGISRSSSTPMPLAASQRLPSSSYKAVHQPDEEDGQDHAPAASAAPVGKKNAGDEEEVVRVQTSATRDLVLDELLDGSQLPPIPESRANKAPDESHDDGGELSHGDVRQALSSSSLSCAVGMQRASSSAGLGRANSADASLEALLAELSSASATAAATLAPFTSSTNAQHPAPSSLNVTAAVGSSAAAPSPFASSSQQSSTSSGHVPASITASQPTDGVSSQLQTSQLSTPSAAFAPSSSSLSPRSSSPALAAAPSASSLSSSPLMESSLAGAQFVGQLQGEFQQHMGALDDDLAFIHEVQTHQTLAAGMNPNVELQVLHKRFNNWKFDFKVKMREIEKAMRQVEKGTSRHALVSRQFSEAALPSPIGRTDSGRTTPTGKLTSPGTTHSGSTTPTGRTTPLGTASSGLTTPTGRITPPGRTPVTGKTTPPGTESGLTTPTGSVTPYGTTTSGRSSPVAAVSVTEQTQGEGHIIATAAAVASGSRFQYTSEDRAAAGTAADDASHDVRGDIDAEAEGLVPRLLSSRSSVKDAVALWEVSPPVSSRRSPSGNRQTLPFSNGQASTNDNGQLPFSDTPSPNSGNRQAPACSHRQVPFSSGQASISSRQKSTSPSTHAQTAPDADAQATRLVTSQSPYQTKSLSEGVYGKLYSSDSSISQDALSAAWNDADPTNEHRIAGSGRHTAIESDAVASGGIGRFGGGIGRGSSKFALKAKPESGSLSADSVLVKEMLISPGLQTSPVAGKRSKSGLIGILKKSAH